jgi:hypothetical protein
MSQVLRCDHCGATAEDSPGYRLGWLPTWLTVERVSPDNPGPWHFCRSMCLSRWAEEDVDA